MSNLQIAVRFAEQSVLSKFLRLGTSGSPTKSKSSQSKSVHFSSQFPEINSAVIAFDDVIATKSVATQTVKCGPEECTTVIIKQASRHALAKNASHSRSNNCDSEQKNNRCRCSAREITNGKQSKHNKSPNKHKYSNRQEASTPPVHHMQAVPISGITGISGFSAVPIAVPISECLICNPETKAFPNRHNLTNNNNNYWSKPNQHFFRPLTASHKSDYYSRQSDHFDHGFDKRSAATGLLYIGNGMTAINGLNGLNGVNGITGVGNGTVGPTVATQSSQLNQQKANEAPKDRVKSSHNLHSHHNHQNHHNFDGHQTAKNFDGHVLSALPTRLNNSCLSEKANDHKTRAINRSLDSQKEQTNRITQNISSIIQNQSNDSNINSGLFVDSSVNVKIEFGSTAKVNDISDQKCRNQEECVPMSEQTKFGFNENTKISTNIHSSNSISRNEEQTESGNNPILTSATTVTTSMSLPNGHSNGNHSNTNGYNNKSDWIPLPTEVTNGIKGLKICNEDNEKSNLSAKQNNLLSDMKINSIPHLSPIRQKVAKAKAEFFNSTGPQSPMSPLVTNLLIDK